MSDNPFEGPLAAVGGTLGDGKRLCVCGHQLGEHLGPEGRCRVCPCDRYGTESRIEP